MLFFSVMTDLETKLLYGDSAGYCSSSSCDEDDNVDQCNESTATKQFMPRNCRNTGPKGVLEDYKICKEQRKEEESKKYEQVKFFFPLLSFRKNL